MIKNKEQFDKKVIALMINFNFKPEGGDVGLELYMANLYNHLSDTFDLTDEQFLKSIDSFLFNGIKYKKFPTSSDFLDSLGMTPEKMASKAWLYMKKMIGVHGRYKSVCFGSERKHLVLHATIEDLGGWVEMCKRTYIEMDKLEEKFKELYVNIYTSRRLKENTFLLGVYPTDPIDLSISATKAIVYDKDNRQSQLDKIYQEQMNKIGWKE